MTQKLMCNTEQLHVQQSNVLSIKFIYSSTFVIKTHLRENWK